MAGTPDQLPVGERVPITDAQIADALVAHDGNMAQAARHLGIRRNTLKTRIETCPDLVILMEDLREEIVDQAETNQRKDVRGGDPQASRFFLQTLGKDRGYSTGVTGTGKGGAIIVELRSFDEPEKSNA